VADDDSVPRAEVDAWTDGVGRMYYGERLEPGDARAGEHAAASLMSGWGLLVGLPSDVSAMIASVSGLPISVTKIW
jgi:hypothetical protein